MSSHKLIKDYNIKAIRGNHEEKIMIMCDDMDLLIQYFEKYALLDLLDGECVYKEYGCLIGINLDYTAQKWLNKFNNDLCI